MNETKYTKGPWKLGHGAIIANNTDEDGDPIVIGVAMGTTKRYPPRGLDCYSIPPQAEAQANKALMLAAPDIYAALKSLYLWTLAEIEHFEAHTPDDSIWDAVRAALAKADGQ